jgi:hypothetical protein
MKQCYNIIAEQLSILIILIIFSIIPITLIFAAMSSDNYKIDADSINIGGSQSNSANYKMEDTVGEVGTSGSTSTNYKLNAGYQAMLSDLPVLSFSISDTSIGFGAFFSTDKRYATSNTNGDTSQPANTNPTYVTVFTNAENGLIVFARSKGNGTGADGNGSAGLYKSAGATKLIPAVAANLVANNTEGYALYVKNVAANLTAASGFDGETATGVISATSQTILSTTGVISADNTADVALKAGIEIDTAHGSYADIVTLICTGKF